MLLRIIIIVSGESLLTKWHDAQNVCLHYHVVLDVLKSRNVATMFVRSFDVEQHEACVTTLCM